MDGEAVGVTFHEEVMSPAQRSVLRRLAPTTREAGFHLGGGTAVAIHLGHRTSLDLDWFTRDAVPDPMLIAQRLRDRGLAVETTDIAPGTLHADLDGVRLSFLEYRYPLLRDLRVWPEYGCQLASLEDLACMKLSAIAGRGARKDFIDVYALGTTGLPLDEMLGLYREKYATEDLGHVVMSLAYFDEAEREAMPEMRWSVDWHEIRSTIEGWVIDVTP